MRIFGTEHLVYAHTVLPKSAEKMTVKAREGKPGTLMQIPTAKGRSD
jgi:hypothetical protein